MLYRDRLKRMLVKHDADHINSYRRGAPLKSTNIAVSQQSKLSLFLCGNGRKQIALAVTVGDPRFYFHNDEDAAVPANDVNFSDTRAPIGLDNSISQLGQERLCDLFTSCPDGDRRDALGSSLPTAPQKETPEHPQRFDDERNRAHEV